MYLRYPVERRKKHRFYTVSEFTSGNVIAVKLAQLGGNVAADKLAQACQMPLKVIFLYLTSFSATSARFAGSMKNPPCVSAISSQ